MCGDNVLFAFTWNVQIAIMNVNRWEYVRYHQAMATIRYVCTYATMLRLYVCSYLR
jgi:hypothetical protein